MKITNNIGKNLKAIQVDDYWVIVEETNKSYKSMWNYEKDNNIPIYQFYYTLEPYPCNKIICSIGKRIDKSIPLIVFKEKSVEELAEEYAEGKSSSEVFREAHIKDFIAFYNQTKFSDKKYTEDDVIDAWELGASEGLPLTRKKKEKLFNSLNQSKLPDIHLEFEEDEDCEIGGKK